jgi:3-oxoacyl-[acyl-carrier-protein] synthase II
MRRVVITGLGIVAPTGIGAEAAWRTALSGSSCIRRIERFDTSSLPVHIAGEVPDFDAIELLGAKKARQTSRFIQFAEVAAKEALDDAGYDRSLHSQICGCIIGVAIGGLGEIEESAIVLNERGPTKILPHTLPYSLPNMASGVVAIEHQLFGPNLAVATACASGTHAIGEAAMHIKRGQAHMMLAGGAEAATCPLSIASFARMKALSRRNDEPELASRPFDADRDGFVMGEGCGLLVLEEYEHAKARGARIYAELVGYGLSADAYHITTPAEGGAGLAKSMQDALRDGGYAATDVDYINAHGTSTKANDALESEAIQNVFGDHARQVSISSTKGATGHCLGAAGGIEAVFTVLAIRDELVPPTANYLRADPACPLDYTPGTAKQRKLRVALSNSSGFGGQNACLAFSQL